SLPAVVLFAVIFLWTPPHFWALAMKFRKDYAAANVPMLPVVADPAVDARKILWYSYAMVAATLALVPYAGWIYGVMAAALGAWFVVEAHQLKARVAAADTAGPEGSSEAKAAPMRLFHLSIAYLTLLFAAVAGTAPLPWGRWSSMIPLFSDAWSVSNQAARCPVLAMSGCLPWLRGNSACNGSFILSR